MTDDVMVLIVSILIGVTSIVLLYTGPIKFIYVRLNKNYKTCRMQFIREDEYGASVYGNDNFYISRVPFCSTIPNKEKYLLVHYNGNKIYSQTLLEVVINTMFSIALIVLAALVLNKTCVKIV